MTKDEALKRALEALMEHGTAYLGHSKEYQQAIIKSKEALTQPEQEPVATLECTYGYNQCRALEIAEKSLTQPKRKPLTDGQKRELIKKSELWDMHVHIGWYSAPSKSFVEKAIQLISEIEAAHDIKEKNT